MLLRLLMYFFISAAMLRQFNTERPDFVSELEYQVFEEHNLLRSNPREYARFLEERLAYFKGNLYLLPGSVPLQTYEGRRAMEEAIAFLKKQEALPTFTLKKGMSQGARDHVNDHGPAGKIGHTGSDRSSPFDRINRYGKWISTAGENICYGFSDAREVLVQLLMDDGVPDRGHRDNIFNSAFRAIGVACGPHVIYDHICVITYAGDYQDKP